MGYNLGLSYFNYNVRPKSYFPLITLLYVLYIPEFYQKTEKIDYYEKNSKGIKS